MAVKVASTNGKDCWGLFVEEEVEEYEIPSFYKPRHLKNLKVGCKLLIGAHWAIFLHSPKQFVKTVSLITKEH